MISICENASKINTDGNRIWMSMNISISRTSNYGSELHKKHVFKK